MKIDKGVCIVMGSALLTLTSLSFVFCPTARAGGDDKAAITHAATPAIAEGDGDGDELLEHWNDPACVGEERKQMAGLAVLLTGAGVVAARRRQKLRQARL